MSTILVTALAEHYSLSQRLAAEKEVELKVTKGFTVTNFEHPYEVELFPADYQNQSFNPMKAYAIGEERNNMFGSRRLIVRPIGVITRKVTNEEIRWPGNVLYVNARDVKGWR
jgi:hypothetical protein